MTEEKRKHYTKKDSIRVFKLAAQIFNRPMMTSDSHDQVGSWTLESAEGEVRIAQIEPKGSPLYPLGNLFQSHRDFNLAIAAIITGLQVYKRETVQTQFPHNDRAIMLQGWYLKPFSANRFLVLAQDTDRRETTPIAIVRYLDKPLVLPNQNTRYWISTPKKWIIEGFTAEFHSVKDAVMCYQYVMNMMRFYSTKISFDKSRNCDKGYFVNWHVQDLVDLFHHIIDGYVEVGIVFKNDAGRWQITGDDTLTTYQKRDQAGLYCVIDHELNRLASQFNPPYTQKKGD